MRAQAPNAAAPAVATPVRMKLRRVQADRWLGSADIGWCPEVCRCRTTRLEQLRGPRTASACIQRPGRAVCFKPSSGRPLGKSLRGKRPPSRIGGGSELRNPQPAAVGPAPVDQVVSVLGKGRRCPWRSDGHGVHPARAVRRDGHGGQLHRPLHCRPAVEPLADRDRPPRTAVRPMNGGRTIMLHHGSCVKRSSGRLGLGRLREGWRSNVSQRQIAAT